MLTAATQRIWLAKVVGAEAGVRSGSGPGSAGAVSVHTAYNVLATITPARGVVRLTPQHDVTRTTPNRSDDGRGEKKDR